MAGNKVALDERRFYVYVVFRSNGNPVYVGKGRGDRYRQHLRRSHNPHLAHIIAKAGGDLPIAKIREGLTNTEAAALEVALIAAIGRLPRGPLVNRTDGGDGMAGHHPSAETRAEKRVALLGRKRPPEHRRRMREGIVENRDTATWSERQSQAHRGLTPTPETRLKMSAARKGKPLPASHREALSAARKGRPLSAKAYESLLKRVQSPEHREAVRQRSQGNKYGLGNRRTPEGQARVTAAVAEANAHRVATEEYREKRRAIAKAMWTARTKPKPA